MPKNIREKIASAVFRPQLRGLEVGRPTEAVGRWHRSNGQNTAVRLSITILLIVSIIVVVALRSPVSNHLLYIDLV
jgi:hypothetical protein